MAEAGEVAKGEGKFEKWVEQGVGAAGFCEEVVFLKAIGEPGDVEEFENGELKQEEAHDGLHEAFHPAGLGMLEREASGESDGDDDEKREVAFHGDTVIGEGVNASGRCEQVADRSFWGEVSQ